MCVLALNIINEKIYVMLWFWLIILAVITSLYMVSGFLNHELPKAMGRIESQITCTVELLSMKK